MAYPDLRSFCSRWITRQGARRSCSQIRTTVQPCFRSCLPTARSRATFRVIFATQKSLFWVGIPRCFVHPCQKHPSTKIAIFSALNTKSGRPRIFCFLRHPFIPCTRKRPSSRNSVVAFPCERTRLIIADLSAGEKTSDICLIFFRHFRRGFIHLVIDRASALDSVRPSGFHFLYFTMSRFDAGGFCNRSGRGAAPTVT